MKLNLTCDLAVLPTQARTAAANLNVKSARKPLKLWFVAVCFSAVCEVGRDFLAGLLSFS
nr:hypothetical protein [uncultured Campylobacter sp.]